ncbi:MAG: hypothetical protein V1870_05535 [Candidatus Aenigmatarchaeota archaeon]
MNVTAEFLKNVLENREMYFRLAVDISRYTREIGKEAGFFTYKLRGLEGALLVFPDDSGKNDFDRGDENSITLSCDTYGLVNVGDENNPNMNPFYLLIDTHSHPIGDCGASDGDLYTRTQEREAIKTASGLDIRVIGAVVAPLHSEGYSSLFLFQEKDGIIPKKISEKLFQDFLAIFKEKNDRFFQYLKKSDLEGYNCEFFSVAKFYEESGLYNAIEILFNEENGFDIPIEDLRRFEFSE